MILHESVWDGSQPVLVGSADGSRTRVGGLHPKLVWLTVGETEAVPLPERPTRAQMIELANPLLTKIEPPLLVAVMRPARPGPLMMLVTRVRDDGMTQRDSRLANLLDPMEKDACSALISLLAGIPDHWPEIAADIEQRRARRGLPPLGRDMA